MTPAPIRPALTALEARAQRAEAERDEALARSATLRAEARDAEAARDRALEAAARAHGRAEASILAVEAMGERKARAIDAAEKMGAELAATQAEVARLRSLVSTGLDLCVRGRVLDEHDQIPPLWITDSYHSDLAAWESEARAALAKGLAP